MLANGKKIPRYSSPHFEKRFTQLIEAAQCCGEVRDCQGCPGETYSDLNGTSACAAEFSRRIEQFKEMMRILDDYKIGIDMTLKFPILLEEEET